MNEDYEEIQKSKYNEAVNQIIRLNEIWVSCHSSRKSGNLRQWNIDLDCAWSELSSDEDLTEDEDCQKYEIFKKLIIKHRGNKNRLYQVLSAKEIFLKSLQNRQGKGSKHTEDDDGL